MKSLGKVIGSISKPVIPGKFQWLIPVRSDEMLQKNCFLESPTFSFSDCAWCVRMLPNGDGVLYEEWTSLVLINKDLQSEKKISFSLSFIFQGIQFGYNRDTHTFKKIDDSWALYVRREEVLQHLAMETKDTFPLSIQIEFLSHLPSEKDRIRHNKTLCQNIKNLRHKKYDLILKAKGEYFRAHQHVMWSRCPTFMRAHDMLVKNRGIVEISDCDPSTLRRLLVYAYTGIISPPNDNGILHLDLDLYSIAAKYNMEYLKDLCCESIRRSLSLQNVCDVIRLALNYSFSSILERAEIYFADNAKEILLTAEWLSFFKEDPISANDFFIKTIKRLQPQRQRKRKAELKT